MMKRIGFWREVQNSYGSTYRAVLMTFVAQDDIPDTEALDRAVRDFCDWAHISRWNDLANGYELEHGVDDRRGCTRDSCNVPPDWRPTPVH